MKLPQSLILQLKQYANVIVRRGVALQNGQLLVITTNAAALYFAQYVAEAAYLQGAGDVQIRLEDEELDQLRVQFGDQACIAEHYKAKLSLNQAYVGSQACFVRLIAPIIPTTKAASERLKLVQAIEKRVAASIPSLHSQLSFQVRRQASPVATVEWAERIFPHLSSEDAFLKLWQVILHITYCDGELKANEDAVLAWDQHIASLLERKAALNELHIRKLHFKNELGTNLTIELADDHQWFGGSCVDPSGIEFTPSIPTEEVFAAPHHHKVNGVVFSSLPLYVNQQCIDQFMLEFKDGKVTSYRAEVGEDVLGELLSTDEGSSRLGEVALVPHSSRLAKQGIVFYETLCDENQACHLALGAGYPGCIVGDQRTPEALHAKGLNQSSIHIDFMFGTSDMLVTATLENGQEKIIMANGEYVS